MLLAILLDIMIPVGCVVACVLVGRHYAHLCAEHRAFCDDMEHDTHQFAEQAQRFARQARLSATQTATQADTRNERTDSIRWPEPPLRTHDPLLAGRSRGRHALPDESLT